MIPLLLGPTLKISVIVSRPFLTHSGFFLCEPPRSAVDKPSAARYNTFQRPSTGANLQLLRRIFSLSQCAAFVKESRFMDVLDHTMPIIGEVLSHESSRYCHRRDFRHRQGHRPRPEGLRLYRLRIFPPRAGR